MTETFNVVPVEELTKFIFDDHKDEIRLPSNSDLLVIRAYRQNGLEVGHLNATFRREHEFDSENGSYVETERYVRIGDITVVEEERRKGISKALIKSLEENAIKFKASKIVGQLTVVDREDQPWLADLYRKLDYQVIETKGAWQLLKYLNL